MADDFIPPSTMYDFIKGWGRRNSNDHQALSSQTRSSHRISSNSSISSYPSSRSGSPEPIINMTALDDLPELLYESSVPVPPQPSLTASLPPITTATKPQSQPGSPAPIPPTPSMEDYVSFPHWDTPSTTTVNLWTKVDVYEDAELQMEAYDGIIVNGVHLQSR